MGCALHISDGFILLFNENGFPQGTYGTETVQAHDTNSQKTRGMTVGDMDTHTQAALALPLC